MSLMRRIPWYPSFVVGLGVVACATTAVKLLLAASTMSRVVGGSFWGWVSPTVLVWGALAVGLWFERSWARWGMRVLVTTNICVMVVTPFIIRSMGAEGRPWMPSIVNIGTTLWMFWLAWWMRFRFEPMGLPLGERLRVGASCSWGMTILLFEQLRRLLGMSYLPWHCDPYVIARGREATWGDISETIAFPEEYDECWVTVGTIPVPSGEVVICDPNLTGVIKNGDVPFVDEVPPRAHKVELQIARLRYPYGLRVLRARILWSNPLTGDLELRGMAMVDLGQLCIIDFKKAARIPDLEIGAFGDKLWRSCRLDGSDGDEMVVFSSGFGDGVYPVYKLIDVTRCFGVYIDMTHNRPEGKNYCLRRRGWAAPKPPGPEEFRFPLDDDEGDEDHVQ